MVFPQREYGVQGAVAVMGMKEEPKHSVFLKTCSCMTSSKCSPEVAQTHTPLVFSKTQSKYRYLGVIFSAAGNKQLHTE